MNAKQKLAQHQRVRNAERAGVIETHRVGIREVMWDIINNCAVCKHGDACDKHDPVTLKLNDVNNVLDEVWAILTEDKA